MYFRTFTVLRISRHSSDGYMLVSKYRMIEGHKDDYGKCSKISNTFLFLNKIIRAGRHKMLVRIC